MRLINKTSISSWSLVSGFKLPCLSGRQASSGSFVFILFCFILTIQSCDLIRMKKDRPESGLQKRVARVNDIYLYQDELNGIVTGSISKEDSSARVNAYINSWIRKQLLISEATKKININES